MGGQVEGLEAVPPVHGVQGKSPSWRSGVAKPLEVGDIFRFLITLWGTSSYLLDVASQAPVKPAVQVK